jgi:catechol 2,3-dioxygenase-like lactoylglutathione lyase family enzyme
MAETIAFYERLGFSVTGRFEQDGQHVWSELSRDEARIHIHCLDHPEMPNAPIFSGVLYLRPDDVRALAEEWRGKIEFYWGPEVMQYGWREFAFRDPNGYIIAFSETTADPPGEA